MRPLNYKFTSWLLAFAIGVTSTFIVQLCLRSVSIRSITQFRNPALQLHPLQLSSLPREEAAPPPEPDEPKRSIALKFRKYSVSEKAEGFYENVADYPQLEDLTTEKARRFNRYIEDSIMDRLKDARVQGKQLIHDIQQNGDSDRLVGALTTSYKILFASQDFISIIFRHSYMATFHPIDGFESINYDYHTGKPLQLAELFKPKTKYLQVLSKLSRKKLAESAGMPEDDWWLKKGTAPTEENFRAWNITPEGIVISFGDYQVGVYAMGTQEVTIPFSNLERLLRRRYILAS